MEYELIVDADQQNTSIALLKDGVLTELHDEKGATNFNVGDIYLGRVKRIVPNLNAAFIDVGYEKDAFLHYLDLGPQFNTLNHFTRRVLNKKQNNANLAEFRQEDDIDKKGKIGDVLSANQPIMVQITKEPISTKGPRLSSEITLPGRFLVLVPFSNKISLSQNIKDNNERKRLIRLMKSIKPVHFGVIIRTVAENQKVAELDSDLRELIDRWKHTFEHLKNAKPPKKLLGEIDKTSALIRDMLNANFSAIHVNNKVVFEDIKDYLKNIAPEREKIVKQYTGKTNIFEKFGIKRQIKSVFGRQVSLKSGAYLIVEHTEAMHVIDVNSGNRKSPGKSQEENALETNLECATEIARILRLRDMGGIIVVDFIDMYQRENQRKLHEHIKECLKEDKAKSNALAPSRFGVVEITRQRVRPETEIKTAESCPTCKGTGEIQPSVLIIDEIENKLEYCTKKLEISGFEIQAHPFVCAFITKGFWSLEKKWWLKYGKKFSIKPNTSFHIMQYKFKDKTGAEIKL